VAKKAHPSPGTQPAPNRGPARPPWPASPSATLARVAAAPLEELKLDFPDEWAVVGQALVQAAKEGPGALEAFAKNAHRAAAQWQQRVDRSHRSPEVVARALPRLAASRMALLGIEQLLLAAAAGSGSGSKPGAALAAAGADDAGVVRLGLWSGLVVQRLLFARGLVRKPVSARTFRWVWPLVPDRRLVMPLVQKKGIYCFFSRELVAALARLVGGRSCLEVAAGDGTLSRFLRERGTQVRATDDQSWRHAIDFPAEVERLDAARALTAASPEVVLCSFPPPGNDFERKVFQTRSVQLYVVITSRHRFAAGDWEAYERQTGFDRQADPGLSRLVLPPELDPAVLLFRRKSAALPAGGQPA
jgi:hypothetical protein